MSEPQSVSLNPIKLIEKMDFPLFLDNSMSQLLQYGPSPSDIFDQMMARNVSQIFGESNYLCHGIEPRGIRTEATTDLHGCDGYLRIKSAFDPSHP
jgi:hypothetical protein